VNDSLTLRRLRTFLSALTAALLVGTVVELLLVGHAEDPIQITPYVLCGLGLVAVAAAWLRPGPRTLLAMRLILAAMAIGSLVGVALHFVGNVELLRETQPNADTLRLLRGGLTGGVPLLAPGILAVSAAVGLAATYSASARETREPATGIEL
jgi:hypothetical protein